MISGGNDSTREAEKTQPRPHIYTNTHIPKTSMDCISFTGGTESTISRPYTSDNDDSCCSAIAYYINQIKER